MPIDFNMTFGDLVSKLCHGLGLDPELSTFVSDEKGIELVDSFYNHDLGYIFCNFGKEFTIKYASEIPEDISNRISTFSNQIA